MTLFLIVPHLCGKISLCESIMQMKVSYIQSMVCKEGGNLSERDEAGCNLNVAH